MIHIEDKTKCSGCMSCYNSCPTKCIQMKEDEEGFWYPIVNSSQCINCGKCENVCPYISNVIPSHDYEICYAAYNKNMVERNVSSSGGIFIMFAKYVISTGGVVYGAAFDDEYMVYHQKAESVDELKKLVGSKYLQSRIESTYIDVYEELIKKRNVLFAGTTCQVAGLRAFLGKEYENLITIDFICLGVPSPKVWKAYLETMYDINSIKFINFKDKSEGWHNFCLRIDNPEKQVKIGRETYYFTGYFKQLFSRPSCSECFFKGKNRVSDITISDCWGYKHIAPEMDDNNGLSSVICHSEKGSMFFGAVKANLIWKDAKIEDVRKYNNNYWKSAPMGKDRKAFWEDFDKISKYELFENYCKPQKNSKILAIVKKIWIRFTVVVNKMRGK